MREEARRKAAQHVAGDFVGKGNVKKRIYSVLSEVELS